MGCTTGGEAFRASFLWEASGWPEQCCAALGDCRRCVGAYHFLSIQYTPVGFSFFQR